MNLIRQTAPVSEFPFLSRAAPCAAKGGLSVLGGDPFEEQNIGPVTELCRRVREACPDKTIWVWTGRKYEHFKDHEIMQFIDTLVDGPYVEKLKVKEQGQYFGSTNQRVIPIKVKAEL